MSPFETQSEELEPLLEEVLQETDPGAIGVALQRLAKASEGRQVEFLVALAAAEQRLATIDPAVTATLIRILHTLALSNRDELERRLDLPRISTLLECIPVNCPNRHLLLQLLAMLGSQGAIEMLVQELIVAPPAGGEAKAWMDAALVLSPLMQSSQWPVGAFFPKVLAAMEHVALAAPILDVGNHLVRSGRVNLHPASDRKAFLFELLGGVVSRLARFEEDPRSFGDDVQTVQEKLSESVVLAVCLCDAVALIGDDSVAGKLHQALELKHRRVQCEAAGSLAKLGHSEGGERLVELAAEPSARLRAIAYADELGLGEKIDASFREPNAIAESEMALWMSQPGQMGVPPTAVEVIDSRRMLWPSFEDPIDVYLVRYEYNFGDRTYSNVGVTGPVNFSLGADVADLPMDDIYAVYAGWHAEHDEIFSVDAKELNDAQARIMSAFADHLSRSDWDSLQPELFCVFLDEHAGVFTATRDGLEVRVITDGLETIEQPVGGRMRPLNATDVFHLYKGRKMLRTFNPGMDDELNEGDDRIADPPHGESL
ncbi:MAG: HEAT repeat domain-containing protein [Planctomycetota bacterium]